MNQFAALHFNTLNSCHHLIWSFMIFLHSPNKLSEEKHPTIKKHLVLAKFKNPSKTPFSPPAPCCSGWCFAGFPLDVPSPSQRALWEPTFEASHGPCDVPVKNHQGRVPPVVVVSRFDFSCDLTIWNFMLNLYQSHDISWSWFDFSFFNVVSWGFMIVPWHLHLQHHLHQKISEAASSSPSWPSPPPTLPSPKT